jgi:hypothetical protein
MERLHHSCFGETKRSFTAWALMVSDVVRVSFPVRSGAFLGSIMYVVFFFVCTAQYTSSCLLN